MANRKISDLTSLTAPATGDLLPIVDISEAAAADKNKKITYAELLASAPAGSAAAPSFSFDGDPNTGIFNPEADTLAFAEGGAEAMRIDSSGRLLVGTSTARSNFSIGGTTYTPQIQFEGGVLQASFVRAASPYVALAHTNTVTSGSNTGNFAFFGSDGTNLISTAEVRSEVDGTPGTNDMPGRLVFSTTAEGTQTPTERMRIDNAGRVLVGTATANTSGAKLQTSNGLTFPATAVASADPNTLDDYEEGTWTITDQSGAGLTLTVYSALYTKIGNKVFIQAQFAYPSTANAATAAYSLPFTAITGNSTLATSVAEASAYVSLANVNQAYAGFVSAGASSTNASMSGKMIYVAGHYRA